jgi:DNA polymerase I
VILEVADTDVEATRTLVEEVLSSVVELAVPLDVDSATGVTWFDAQKH